MHEQQEKYGSYREEKKTAIYYNLYYAMCVSK